jgi:uncharacterized surface protein with fasciclin (FAS1) repeats
MRTLKLYWSRLTYLVFFKTNGYKQGSYMITRLAAIIALGIIASVSVAGCTVNTTATSPTPTPLQDTHGRTITQVASDDESLTTFVSLMQRANLTDVLDGPGNFTVFAPTNAAFDKINEATISELQSDPTALKNVSLYHIIPERLTTTDFRQDGGTVTTVSGLALPYETNSTTVRIDGATIIGADIGTSNGVLHKIDSVLIPPSGA